MIWTRIEQAARTIWTVTTVCLCMFAMYALLTLAIERGPPTDFVTSSAGEPIVTKRHSYAVYRINRHRVCTVHVDRWFVDSRGVRSSTPPEDVTSPGPIGNGQTLKTAFVIPESVAPGRVTLGRWIARPNRLWPFLGVGGVQPLLCWHYERRLTALPYREPVCA